MIEPLIGYAPLHADPLVGALIDFASDATASAARRVAEHLVAVDTAPAAAVARHVLEADGPITRAARRGADARQLRILARELAILGAIAHTDLVGALGAHGLADYVPAAAEGTGTTHFAPGPATALIDRMARTANWGDLAPEIAEFARMEGVGPLAVHRSLRVVDGTLTGIAHPDVVREDDLVGGEEVRQRLAGILEAFVAGGPAVDVLLYGPPGTGKSTTVHALASAFVDQGLRLVQIDRRDVHALGSVMEQLRGVGPRCIIVLDDLVFDDNERSDRDLRAMLEGDASQRPTNVAVWATSNRMRLIHETRSEREDDLEEHLGRGERSALASRFGVRIGFGMVTVEEFVALARELASRHGVPLAPDFDARARRFAVDRGLTPRAARQYADLSVDGILAGENRG